MKSGKRMIGMTVLCAGLLLAGMAQGQCFQEQFDVDFVFNTLDSVVADLLPTWLDHEDEGGNPVEGAWRDVLYQTSPYFGEADNDGNAIDDDDHFDLLAAVLNGDLTQVLSGLSADDVQAIRSAFAANAAYVETLNLTINNVAVSAYGLNGTTNITTGASDVCVKLGFTTLCVSQFVDDFEGIPTLWQLLEDQSPLFKQGLINLIAGYMTIGEANGADHLKSLFRVIIQTVLRDVLPSILADLKTDDIHIELDLDGVNITIDIAGSDIDNCINGFVAHFNCSEFQCKESLLGAAGDLNHDGTTNGASYTAAGENRQAWMGLENIQNPPLQIVTQPQSQTVGSGTPVTFSIEQAGSLTGVPDAYKWEQIDIEDFSPEGSPVYAPELTLAYPLPTSEPKYYMVTICDSLWTRRSAPAQLVVNYAPLEVTTHPAGASLLIPGEDSHSMNVVVRGGNALPTFQWQKWDGAGWVNLDGKTGSSISWSPIQLADGGDYRCLITSGAEQVASNTATITILNRIRFEPHPVGGGVYVGEPFTFTANVAGEPVGELHYQWRFNGVDIESATGAEYVIESAVLEDAGDYSCVISDDVYTIPSRAAALVVADHLEITQQPQSGAGILGYDFTFTVAVSGGLGDIHYQWQRDGGNIGPDSATFLLNPLVETDAGTYTCTISDSRESVTSDSAVLEVFPPFDFLQQPQGALKHTGESHTFTVEVSGGSPPYHYQWRKDGQDLPYQENTFTLDSLQPSDSGAYTCFVSDQNAGATSSTAVLDVKNWMSFEQQPQSAAVYQGRNHTFSVVIDGGLGTVTYAWFKKVGPANINLSVNSPNLVLTSVLPETAGQYFCRVTDDFEMIESDIAELTVVEPLQFTAQPKDAYRFDGADAQFSITTSGGLGTINYQWFKDGEPIGDNAGTLVLPDVTKADEGVYHCEVTDDVMTSVSGEATLTVFPKLPPEGANVMVNPINGQQVVPPVSTQAAGMAFGILQPVEGSDNYTITLSGTHSVSMAFNTTINYGWPGENGPVVFDLGNTPNLAMYRVLENGQAAELMAGLYYLIIRSTTYLDGEIRGQMQVMATPRTLTINVEGGGATSPAAGTHNYWNGQIVEVTALNVPGVAFDHWAGDIGQNNPANPVIFVTLSADSTITAFFVESPEGEGEGPVEGEGEGPMEGEGEGPVEGEGEGPVEGEGEGCALSECPDFDAEGAAFYTSMSASFNWASIDLDLSGIADSWEVALFTEGLCENGGGYGEALLCAYQDNLTALRGETGYPALQPYENIIAALATMSTSGLETVSNLGLSGTYAVFTAEEAEPFSSNGDPDGDGLSNAQEYASVLAAELGRADYVLAALTPNAPEGEGEGPVEGEGEGPVEGEGEGPVEGEGEGDTGIHSADQNGNSVIELTELLRVIQFFNSAGYRCADAPGDTEDGFLPGAGANHSCAPHATDYNPQDWQIALTELLRLIQFFNTGGYHVCEGGEDGYCPGPAA